MRSSNDVIRGSRAMGVHLLGLLAAVAGAGCMSALPVRQVVVYRNGIAYFERGGYVTQTQVRFKMQQSGVGDFLATLAVSEQAHGGTSGTAPVRAIDVDGQGDGSATPLETVVLTLDGHPHDLHVGYIGESPIWKPSYRLILHPGGTANFQLWGIVQNLSGEDWKAVKLSLVAGAPIAFQSDLQTPVMPGLPMVTDQGEPMPTRVRGEATYAYRAESGAMGQVMSSTTVASSTRGDPSAAARSRAQAQMNAAALGPRNAADVSVRSGNTRYDIPSPVTIPSEGSSMVMVLDRPLPGEMLLFYAPNADVPESATHPFRAARFVNDTGGALEPGPVTMFEDGAFLSQAVLEPIPAGGSGMLPLGVETSVSVTARPGTDERAGKLTNDGVGGLTVARTRVTRTAYRVSNDSAQAVKVIVKHTKVEGARLVAPEGTEEGIGKKAALVPAVVPAHASTELVVEDDAPESGPVDWFSPSANAAVRAYLADPHADPIVAKKLEAVWSIRNDIVKLMEARDSLRHQQYDWARKEGTAHSDAASKAANLAHQIDELESKIAALTAHFKVALGDIVAPWTM